MDDFVLSVQHLQCKCYCLDYVKNSHYVLFYLENVTLNAVTSHRFALCRTVPSVFLLGFVQQMPLQQTDDIFDRDVYISKMFENKGYSLHSNMLFGNIISSSVRKQTHTLTLVDCVVKFAEGDVCVSKQAKLHCKLIFTQEANTDLITCLKQEKKLASFFENAEYKKKKLK